MEATLETAAQVAHNYSLDDVLLGKRVKIARKEKRLTQEELASLCDCTPTHICNIENGKIGISLELLFKISILLGKSMDYFVMDNPGADPQVKINSEIAPKLAQCNPVTAQKNCEKSAPKLWSCSSAGPFTDEHPVTNLSIFS